MKFHLVLVVQYITSHECNWDVSSVMWPGIIGCFGSRNIIHPHPGDPARVDQVPTYVPVATHNKPLRDKPWALNPQAEPAVPPRPHHRNYSAGIGLDWYMEGLGAVGCLLARLLRRLTRSHPNGPVRCTSLPTFHSGVMESWAVTALQTPPTTQVSLLKASCGLLGFFLTEDAG